MSPQEDVVPGDRVPTGDSPGAGSTPADEGQGVVDVGDRTDGGSPAANQSKTEPMPPAPTQPDPDAAAGVPTPDLESMNVGAGDPQAPSHASAGARESRDGAGIASVGTPVAEGMREQPTTGSALRTPGSLGADEERIETDVETSASQVNPGGTPGAASGAGDAASVPVVSEETSPGTSQESAETHSARTPQ